MGETILKMTGITKRFPGVLALDHVNFDLKKGEIHALIGENGAGKSTLMKVLGGVHAPDAGSLEVREKAVRITSPSESMALGIGVIYQEFNLVQTLDVAENLFLGHEITDGSGRMKRKEMYEKASQVMEQLGIREFDCGKKIRELSVAMQQLVEIGKAMFHDVSILVMDEPTAVLTDRETVKLFEMMMRLKEKGISIIYISHRLEEVIALCDRITVLRDGCYIETLDNNGRQTDKDLLISKMVGRQMNGYYPEKSKAPLEDVELEVRDLTKKGLFENISFHVNRGETLGFSGLVGAGRSEIMKAVFGDIRLDSGEILLEGCRLSINSPQAACRAGLALVPEDRKKEGANLGMSVSDNIAMASHKELTVAGHFIRGKRKRLVERYIKELQIRPAVPERPVRNLSGGNQQKVVVAKWLATNPKVMILDEPTRGIDVGAKAEMYELINRMTSAGMAVILVSSELPELLGLCDRIIVIREGTISGEFKKEEFDQDAIMKAAAL